MVNFLMRTFVKAEKPAKRREQLGTLAGSTNIVCNVALFVGKLLVGIVSGSVAVTADAFNNLSDCASSLVTVAGFRLANRPPDSRHPFGYGRVEYIAGVVVSVLILMVGLEFVKNSVGQILNPAPVSFSWTMLAVMVAAILVKLWMCLANLKMAREMGGSSTISATVFDSLSDMATTAVAALSLILAPLLSFPIDGWLGALIALAVLVGGVKVLIDTVSPLLGQPPDPEMVETIRQRLLSYDGIVGIHDMMVHNYGPNRTMVSVHAEVPADNNIIYAHEQIDRAEREIGEEMGVTMLIHLDPIVINDSRVNEVHLLVERCLQSVSPSYTMHDFRMLDGKQQINVIFDVLVPYKDPRSDEQVVADIEAALKAKDARLHPIITVDKSYVG